MRITPTTTSRFSVLHNTHGSATKRVPISTIASNPYKRHHVPNSILGRQHLGQQQGMQRMPYHSTTALRASFLPTSVVQTTKELALPIMGILSVALAGVYWKYRGAINYRLKLLREESWIFGAGVTMERVTDHIQNRDNTLFANLKLLELNPDFKADCEEKGWSVYSLGDYMSSLRPKQMPKIFDMNKVPDLVQKEVEAGLAAALLKVLGPNLGRALLPVTGVGAVQKRAQSFAADVTTKYFLSNDSSATMTESGDKAGIPVSLMTLLAASDLNARVNSGKDIPNPAGFSNIDVSAIEKMKAGEVVKGPSFAVADPESRENLVPPDNFIIERDFLNTVKKMETKLAKQNDATGQTDTGNQLMRAEMADAPHVSSNTDDKMIIYDPEDRRLPEPVPVNPRLFPGLHLGYGKAICSHTKREVLKMRLLSVLLNRLGSNYHKRTHGQDDEIFTVQMNTNSKPISTPWEFVQALIDSGHTIEVVPTTHLTTFGVNLCVKEKDNTWSNIPLSVFLESGYEDRDGRMAPAMMPHSGLDMYIKGPLAGNRGDGTVSELRVQHFNGIEGFCGWHSNEHPEVPFNVDVETGPRLTGKDAVRAARIAGLYAATLNGLATELKLPFGGYGLTAVCNDSAALVQQCLYNETTIYPMTSVGRFMQRAMRYGQDLADNLDTLGGYTEEVKDLCTITQAFKKLPSDLNASPANAGNAAKRMLATMQPNLPFLLSKDSKAVMESILDEEDCSERIQENEKTKTKQKSRIFSLTM